MPEYRRVYIEGGTYFITIVTYNRQPIFNHKEASTILQLAWERVSNRYPFSTVAICLLPDHLHTVITLPEGDSNYSMRIREICAFLRVYISITSAKGESGMNRTRISKKPPFGSVDFGSTPSVTNKIFTTTSITSITTRLNTVW